MKINGKLSVPDEVIDAFCRKWKVTQVELFGSALREDFGPDSDVDLMVTFEDDAPWSLYEIVDMRDELEGIFGRKVDLAERPAVEKSKNSFRRNSILSTARVVYRLA